MSQFISIIHGCRCRTKNHVLVVLPDIGNPVLPYEPLFSLPFLKQSVQGYILKYDPKADWDALRVYIGAFLKKLPRHLRIHLLAHGRSHRLVPFITTEVAIERIIIIDPFSDSADAMKRLADLRAVPFQHPQLAKEYQRFNNANVQALHAHSMQQAPASITTIPTLVLILQCHESRSTEMTSIYTRSRVESIHSANTFFFLIPAFRQFLNNIFAEFFRAIPN